MSTGLGGDPKQSVRNRIFAILAVVALGILGLQASASAATPNDTACVAGIKTSDGWNSEDVKKYNTCRFDKLDAQIAANQKELLSKLGATTPPATPSPTPTPTVTPKPSATPTPTPTASPTPTPTATTTPADSVCTKPVVKFGPGNGSAGLGTYGFPNYDASQELWNVNGYTYSQYMSVCSNDVWTVDATADNSKADGAVKAYPSVRRIYHDWSTQDFSKDPRLSSLPQLKAEFGSKDPSNTGMIYNTAFDIWLNGIGNGQATELMIWTHNVNQSPYGTKVATGVELGGHTWDLYSGNSNHYIAYVPTDTKSIPSGTVDVKEFVDHLKSVKRVADSPIANGTTDPVVSQVSFGVEIVSTGAASRHWDFTKFSITDK